MPATLFKNIAIDKFSSSTLQQQLYKQLSQMLIRGQIPAGTKLPPSRRLAQELGVSRNTITAVLEQLKSEGFLASRGGSGVYANEILGKLTGKTTTEQRFHLPKLSRFGSEVPIKQVNDKLLKLPFTTGIPDLRAFPSKIWLQLIRQHNDRQQIIGYGGYQGYEPLRLALSRYLTVSRGVRCQPQQIIITQGSQEAISLCSQVLLDEGDSVLIENPGYTRARQVFKSRHIDLHTIDVGAQGIDPDSLPQNSPAKLLYTTPTHQYPLGGIIPAPQRLQLLQWASAHNIWIIEDDYDSEFHFHGKTITAMQGMAAQTPVIYMGSFSKTLLPSLRLGYLVVPEVLVPAFIAAKGINSGESPLLMQMVTADFIKDGHFERHLRKMRTLYHQKWLHTEQLIAEHLDGLASVISESAGMHLCLVIDGIDDIALLREFNAMGFGGTALSEYYGGDAGKTGLVLGFAYSTHSERCTAIKALKKLLEKPFKVVDKRN